jgi:hypothetical protein
MYNGGAVMEKTVEILLKENTEKVSNEVRVKIAQEIRDCPLTFEEDVVLSEQFMAAMKEFLGQVADFIEEQETSSL